MTPELLAALKVLLEESLGDWVYDVRARAATSNDGFEGNSWEHPRVKTFSGAVTTIHNAVKEADQS